MVDYVNEIYMLVLEYESILQRSIYEVGLKNLIEFLFIKLNCSDKEIIRDYIIKLHRWVDYDFTIPLNEALSSITNDQLQEIFSINQEHFEIMIRSRQLE